MRKKVVAAALGAAVAMGTLGAALPAQAQDSGPQALQWRELVTVAEAAANKTAWGRTLELTGHQGKIWAGYGDWDANTGPIARIEVDPATGTYVNHGLTDTERLSWVSEAGEILGIQWDSKHNYWLNGGNSGAVYVGATERLSGFKAIHVLDVTAAQTSQGLGIWAVGSGSDTDDRATEKSNAALVWKSTNKGDFERIVVVDEDTDPGYTERLYWVQELDGKVYAGGHLQRSTQHSGFYTYTDLYWTIDPVTNRSSRGTGQPCGSIVPVAWNGSLWCGTTKWTPTAKKKDQVVRGNVSARFVGDDGALYGSGSVNGASQLYRNDGSGFVPYALGGSYQPAAVVNGQAFAVNGSTVMVADLPEFGAGTAPDASAPQGAPTSWTKEVATNTAAPVEGQPYIAAATPGVLKANQKAPQRFVLTGTDLDKVDTLTFRRDMNAFTGGSPVTIVEKSADQLVVEVSTWKWKSPGSTHTWGAFIPVSGGVSQPGQYGWVMVDHSFYDTKVDNGSGNNGSGNNGGTNNGNGKQGKGQG